MASAIIENRVEQVRLNELDWGILEVMSDGQRYTQQHLYDDIEALEEHSDDWIRKRVSHLYDNALIQKVGTSSMYEISEYGEAALELRDEGEIPENIQPPELGRLIRERAEE